MKWLISFLSLICIVFSLHAQELTEIGQLPDFISEPSGVEIIYNTSTGQFEYWMHNDYAYPDSIFSFRLDDLSSPTRILDVGLDYVDWEDMTTDEEGNIYLGDFGNWVQQDELQIVILPNPNSVAGELTRRITYEYPFSGVSDTEAMFHHRDHLYLFSKRVNPSANIDLDSTLTYCFRIPDTGMQGGGRHVAELVGSFQFALPNDADLSRIRVTAADISPDAKQVALLCYERLWIFSCFENLDFFKGEISRIPLIYRQYEGMSFVNNHELIITKEGSRSDPNFNPKIYHLNVNSAMPETCLDCEKLINGNFEIPDNAWTLFLANSGTAAASLDLQNGSAVISVEELSSSQWHANMRQKGLVMEQGKNYSLSYSAFADEPTSMSVIINSPDGTNGHFYDRVELTSQSQTFTHEFTMELDTDFNSYLSFNFGNSALTNIYLDNISLVEIECSKVVSNEGFVQEESDPIRIYPNPTYDKLQIDYVGWGEETSIELYSSTSELTFISTENHLSLEFLPRGFYFLLVKNGNKIVGTEKLVRL